MADDYPRRLEQAKRQSLAQRLFRCARLWNEQALAEVRALSGQPVRPAHAALFPHIDLEGTRQTELARRLGVSKQAVGQLVEELESMGMVERRPDPEDGRSRRVHFTARGREGLLHGLGLLAQMEAELGAELGAERLEAVGEGLDALEAALERRALSPAAQPRR